METGESAGSFSRHLRQAQLQSRHLCSLDREATLVAKTSQPLQLLELPVDILESVIKEVTHTNDLTALALTHSALHALVIPHIYSRFDIVWPEGNSAEDRRDGVDALTYGLSTLVKAHDVFGEVSMHRNSKSLAQACLHCGRLDLCSHKAHSLRPRKTRRGNHFAEYTRKFSLGNGPPDLVQDYAITRESGKMLGTLIALAVGRMRNLEAFIFDMPTGVLRDVWLALASLADREDGQECRLEEVRVRWHDNNSETSQDERQIGVMGIPGLSQASQGLGSQSSPFSHSSLFDIPPYPRVEFPTFSVLPPLRSLGALDIDEPCYVEEMSVLIEASMEKLRELRVGVAAHSQTARWVIPIEDMSYGVSNSMKPTTKPGGILGILLDRICDIRPSTPDRNELDGTPNIENAGSDEDVKADMAITTGNSINETAVPGHLQSVVAAAMLARNKDGTEDDEYDTEQAQDINNMSELLENHIIEDSFASNMDRTEDQSVPVIPLSINTVPVGMEGSARQVSFPFVDQIPRSRAKARLKLEVLELERIPLNPVISKAIDWTRLTTLTLLGCRKHTQLWTALRKKYAPPSQSRTSSLSLKTPKSATPSFLWSSVTPKASSPRRSFALQIRRLHTDTVSPSLLTFINTTLAPDTLEHLFLQASPECKATIPISQIYRLAIRRHRASLRKLLIDSSVRYFPSDSDDPNIIDRNDTSYHAWVFSRELLTAITSGGKMHLRELSLNLAQRDWHFLLQRLPQAKELRSLHIMRIAPDVPRDEMDENPRRQPVAPVNPRETAMQVLDVVALRPEMELCYLGVGPANCYEVVEYEATSGRKGRGGSFGSSSGGSLGDGEGHLDVDADSGEDDDGGHTALSMHGNESDVDSENLAVQDPTTDEDEEGGQERATRKGNRIRTFKLRDILFYEDKVPIFKARHGRL